MSRSLSKQKDILYMSPETQKLWFLFTSQHIQKKNIFLKEMCQKSKMDTTIDFVKIFKRQYSLENYSEK